jgi:hypothetical protein
MGKKASMANIKVIRINITGTTLSQYEKKITFLKT